MAFDEDAPPIGTACKPCKTAQHFCQATRYKDGSDDPLCEACFRGEVCATTIARRPLTPFDFGMGMEQMTMASPARSIPITDEARQAVAHLPPPRPVFPDSGAPRPPRPYIAPAPAPRPRVIEVAIEPEPEEDKPEAEEPEPAAPAQKLATMLEKAAVPTHPKKKPSKTWKPDKRVLAVQLIADGYSSKAIMERTGLSKSAVRLIRRKFTPTEKPAPPPEKESMRMAEKQHLEEIERPQAKDGSIYAPVISDLRGRIATERENIEASKRAIDEGERVIKYLESCSL